jgi:hypothetical protein
MPPTIKHSTDQERKDIFNAHYAAKYLAGEFHVREAPAAHPARGRAWCISSQIVKCFDKATGEMRIVGHRHMRDGKCLTKNGLDPKWILHDGVILKQMGPPPSA